MSYTFSFEAIVAQVRNAMLSNMGLTQTHIAETGIDAIDPESAGLALPYGLLDIREVTVDPMASSLKAYRLRLLIDCYCMVASTPGANSRKSLRTKLFAFADAVANTRLPDGGGAPTCVMCQVIGFKTQVPEAERTAKTVMAGCVQLQVLHET